MEVVETVSAGGQERADVVCQPERLRRCQRRIRRVPGNVQFGNEHGNIGRQAVIPPDLENVADQRGLVVQTAPLNLAGLEGIVLERHERQIAEPAVSLQIVNEASQP